MLSRSESNLAPVEIVGSSREDLASGLTEMEGSMGVGEKARVTFCTEMVPTDEDLAGMYLDMVAIGCHVSYPTRRVIDGIPTTEFVLEKGSPAWPLIIPLIVPLFVVGLIAFGITRIETITRALVPIILISVGGLIILAAALSKPATKYIERGGKIPYLPSTKKKKLDIRDLALIEEELGVSSSHRGRYELDIIEASGIRNQTWYDDENSARRVARKIQEELGFKVNIKDTKSGVLLPSISKKALAAR